MGLIVKHFQNVTQAENSRRVLKGPQRTIMPYQIHLHRLAMSRLRYF